MKNNKLKTMLLAVMLIASLVMIAGCGTSGNDNGTENPADAAVDVSNVLGEGQTMFIFNVIDAEGNTTGYEIHTDKETVGDALLENDLIAGDDSEYGLYIKEVTGITADYDVDGTYWAFYINGEYATSGADTTAIEDGETYTLKVEK